MVKQTITYEEAEKVYEDVYAKGKVGKSFSICQKLHDTYKDFCYIDMHRQEMSERVRVLIVRDMLENCKNKN